MLCRSILLYGSFAVAGSTTPLFSKRLSRKDRRGLVPPGPTEVPWAVLVNEISSEICRTRQLTRSHHVQNRLLQRAEQLAIDHEASRRRGNLHVEDLFSEVRLLLVEAGAFHLGAVLGSDAGAAERIIVRLSERILTIMSVMKLTRKPIAELLDKNDIQHMVGLMLLASSFVSNGLREWGLLAHDKPLTHAAKLVDKWARQGELLCPAVLSSKDVPTVFCGEPGLSKQRQWLASIPSVMLVITNTWIPMQWSNRLCLTALANALSMGKEVEKACAAHDDDRGKGTGTKQQHAPTNHTDTLSYLIEQDLGLFWRGEGRDEIKQATTTLPRWALGVLLPLVGGRDTLHAHWWPAHIRSLSLPVAVRETNVAPVVSNSIRLSSALTAVKSINVEMPNKRIVVHPTSRRVFCSYPVLDNTRVELSTLTLDIVNAIPNLSSLECREALRMLHDRSYRPVSNVVTKHLLESAVRLLLLRYVRLLDKATERVYSKKHSVTALQVQNVELELAKFREVYDHTSGILMRWGLPDDNVPLAYWSAVTKYLS